MPGQLHGVAMSPGSEAREKERVTLLLDINRELLLEVMRLQSIQAEAKAKTEAMEKGEEGKGDKNGDGKESEAEKEKDKDRANVVAKEFVE
jgi:hypothetical protein